MLQVKRFHSSEHAAIVCTAWTEILFDAINLALINASRSGSWLSSLTPSFISGASTNLANNFEATLDQFTIVFDRLSQQIILFDDSNGICANSSPLSSDSLFERYVSYIAEKKLLAISSSSSVASKLASLIESPNQSVSSSLNPNSSSTSSSWSLFNLLSWSTNEMESPVYYLPDRNIFKSEWCTPLHLLLRQWINRKVAREQKKLSISKKFVHQHTESGSITSEPQLPYYLAFLLIEADIRKCARIWDQLIFLINDSKSKKSYSIDNNEEDDGGMNFEHLLKVLEHFFLFCLIFFYIFRMHVNC